ncbi:MAG: hypothetical protein JSU96_13140 [Acidobacteriota bacterium]|nr:MAG: hypothetical protein JSU96_13140 [Acidobacteriota bacterium]
MRTKLGCRVFGLSLLAFLVLGTSSFGNHVRYLTSVGSGSAGQVAFRTSIQLSNEHGTAVTGKVSIVAGEGMEFEGTVSPRWVGQEGTFSFEGGEGELTVPPASSLILMIEPRPGVRVGWARLETDLSLGIESSVEFAGMPGKEPADPPDFDHYLQHQAELFPTEGVKQFSFPIRLFDGLKRVGTAFSVANLAGVEGTVQLTYRPDVVREVRLAPGQMVSDYFNRFWELAFPAIFPLDVRGAAEVSSNVPLGVTVFSTLNDLPTKGIPAVEIPGKPECAAGTLDEPFELGIDQCASFPGNVSLTFWNVAEDSRCPVDVVCVWEGRVVVEIVARVGNRKEVLRLGLTEDTRKATFGDLEIELNDVKPAPESTEVRSIDEYTVELIVRQQPPGN